jgi:hypothetical protein
VEYFIGIGPAGDESEEIRDLRLRNSTATLRLLLIARNLRADHPGEPEAARKSLRYIFVVQDFARTIMVPQRFE